MYTRYMLIRRRQKNKTSEHAVHRCKGGQECMDQHYKRTPTVLGYICHINPELNNQAPGTRLRCRHGESSIDKHGDTTRLRFIQIHRHISGYSRNTGRHPIQTRKRHKYCTTYNSDRDTNRYIQRHRQGDRQISRQRYKHRYWQSY
jgi:hypothetical protein